MKFPGPTRRKGNGAIGHASRHRALPRLYSQVFVRQKLAQCGTPAPQARYLESEPRVRQRAPELLAMTIPTKRDLLSRLGRASPDRVRRARGGGAASGGGEAKNFCHAANLQGTRLLAGEFMQKKPLISGIAAKFPERRGREFDPSRESARNFCRGAGTLGEAESQSLRAPGPRFCHLEEALERGRRDLDNVGGLTVSRSGAFRTRSSTPLKRLLSVATRGRRRALRERVRRPPTPLEDSPGEARGRE